MSASRENSWPPPFEPTPAQKLFYGRSPHFRQVAHLLADIKGIPEGVSMSEEELEKHFTDTKSICELFGKVEVK